MKIIYSHSNWNVIDPQNQIVESFSSKQCAKDYLKALEVPYKEFYKVKEHKVMRREGQVMIKMTTELFEKFSKKQEELDSMIREKFGISEVEWKYDLNIQHSIALRVELHELVNECHDVWKYWKQKAVNPDRIIDELVDVIHFLHLILNKMNYDADYHVREINKNIPNDEQIKYVTDTLGGVFRVNYLIKSDELHETYAHLLVLADRYAFTLDDIEQAYDRKNAENHQRQESGY